MSPLLTGLGTDLWTCKKEPTELHRSVRFYLYSPYTQIPNCLVGLNKVGHPLTLTLNKSKEKLPQKTFYTSWAPVPNSRYQYCIHSDVKDGRPYCLTLYPHWVLLLKCNYFPFYTCTHIPCICKFMWYTFSSLLEWTGIITGMELEWKEIVSVIKHHFKTKNISVWMEPDNVITDSAPWCY